MTTVNAEPHVDPTNPDHLHLWFDPSRLGRGQLMKAAAARGVTTSVSMTNVELINQLVQWLEGNNIRKPEPVEVEEDDEVDLGELDMFEDGPKDAAKTPATGAAPSAVAPVAGQSAPSAPQDNDMVAVSREQLEQWGKMQATLERLLSGQSGAVAKPLAEVAAPTTVSANGMPTKTGIFPGGYRAEHLVGPRNIDDGTHHDLIVATHEAARAAGYRTKGYPNAGLRISFSTDDRHNRTAIYEVAIFKE